MMGAAEVEPGKRLTRRTTTRTATWRVLMLEFRAILLFDEDEAIHGLGHEFRAKTLLAVVSRF